MDSRFSDISVLVWDFDGTLYRSQDELFTDVREAEYQVIINHTGWPHQKAEEEFKKLHKVVTPSGTMVTSILSKIPLLQAALETEHFFDRNKYLRTDGKLIALFQSLTRFRHLIISNGIEDHIIKALESLGLSALRFEKIITPEITGIAKPDPRAFEMAIEYTRVAPEKHLMIGDRPAVDLVPARALGMKTCLVSWGQPFSESEEASADVVIPRVYDLSAIIS